jgi:hypothetical protein
MAIGGGIPSHALPSWLPTLPIGTPEVVLAIVVLIGFMVLLYFLYRPKSPRTKKQAHASL